MDVLFVTGDEKEDWWWRYRSEFLGPRSELVVELKTSCERQLYMVRPIDLLKRASALAVTVREESVEDVARVSRRESEEHPAWTETGVAALLEALETEGREQADVIRAAAQAGGTIDRDAIYAISDYDDDRMLRGFTRPTARITRDLQTAGVVANGVDAALTPIYHGGVKALAFRVPPEMVSILADDEPLRG
jgi:prophage DNA circulation protein